MPLLFICIFMKKKLEKFIKYIFYATFFVPLLVVPRSYIFPFIVPKILVLRSLIFLMLGLYILLLCINFKEYKPKLTWLSLVVSLFLLSFGISTFVGVDPYHSFWDNHERMLGLFTVLHYGIYYFIGSAMFKEWADWKWALRIFLLAGSVVMGVALLQHFYPDILLNQGSDRSSSTLGNPIYVGGYALFLMFVSYLLYIKEAEIVWKWAAAILGFLAFIGLLTSGTRGSLVGLLVGLLVGIILYAIYLKNSPRLRKVLWIIIGFGMIMTVVLFVNRKAEWVVKIPAIGRTVSTSWSEVVNSPRLIAWSIGVQSFKEKPVFGWGPNNFFYAFNTHYNPKSLEHGYPETWFDNAHNILVNTLTVQGLFGIITYIGIFIIGIISLIIARRRGLIDLNVSIIGSSFLVAHLVQNVTVFENPTSYLYFFFWLAFINQSSIVKVSSFWVKKESNLEINNNQNSVQNQKIEKSVSDKNIGFGTISIVGVIIIFAIIIFNFQPAKANTKTFFAIQKFSELTASFNSNPNINIQPGSLDSVYLSLGVKQAVEESLKFNSPHIDDIRADLGRTVAQATAGQYAFLSTQYKLELLNTVYPELQKNTKLHPLDIRNQLYLAQLAQNYTFLTNNQNYLKQAEEYLEEALSKSPKRQQIIYSLSLIKVQLNKPDEGVKLLEQAIQDNPKISESYWRLAYIYILLNKSADAQKALDLAKQNGATFSPDEQSLISQFMAEATSSVKVNKK